MNVCTFMGRIGRIDELRHTPSGKPVLNFSLAVQKNKTDTLWIGCALWGDKAVGLQPFLEKGQLVCVSGRVNEVRAYTHNNEPRAELVVGVDQLTFGQRREQREEPEANGNRIDDDIPF